MVKDLQVDVHITENCPITVVHVPKFAPKLSDKSNQELIYYQSEVTYQVIAFDFGD